MARKYTARGRYYDVQGPTAKVGRPNRTAAGMTYTRQRSRHGGESLEGSDAIRLAVRGTLARTSSLGYYMERVKSECPCCHQAITKWRLNAAGKRRLHHFRLARAKRQGIIQIEHPCN